MNPLTISQERIQGLVWLISLIGCYVSAWCLFAYRKKITGDGDAAGIRFALVVGATMLTLTGSCTYEEHWGEAPPPEIAELAFKRHTELQPLAAELKKPDRGTSYREP